MDPKRRIAEERSAASFDIETLKDILWGGRIHRKNIEAAYLQLERDPVLNLSDKVHDLSRQEHRALCMDQTNRWISLMKACGRNEEQKRYLHIVLGSLDPSLSMKLYVHDLLFRETCLNQGTDEQFEFWGPLIDNYEILGCFAMTELGTSSFLRGIETTATYDKQSDEFIVFSPSLTSTKWWIGMAGQTATHTVALCRLITENEDRGLYWFVVQLRDRATGTLMPGVTCGDVGEKTGRNGLDNGFIQFSNVRIPRKNMLMRWGSVNKDGNFEMHGNPLMSYNTLIGERILSVHGSSFALMNAITIGVRYGVVRVQGTNDCIMDYQSHYRNLIPIIAGAYVTRFAALQMWDSWQEISKATTAGEDQVDFGKIGEMHALGAGMKCAVGFWTCNALEEIRRSMGGYSYSSYSNITRITNDFVVNTQGGGSNIVLAQQHGRFLLNAWKKVKSGKHAFGAVSFLNNTHSCNSSVKCEAKDVNGFLDLTVIENILKTLTAESIKYAADSLMDSAKKNAGDVWNENMMKIIECSKLHSYLQLLEYSKLALNKVEDTVLRSILTNLLILFFLTSFESMGSSFFQFGENYISSAQFKLITEANIVLCKKLRKEIVGLTDAFMLPDFVLNSPFGCFDGDVYLKYMSRVKAAPNCLKQHPDWVKYISPFTKEKSSL